MYAQSENYAKYYNKGNKLYENNFEEAEKNFRVAIDDTLSDLRATFNLSNKYYTEGLFDEAISRQIQAVELAKNKSEKHKAFHNLGNFSCEQEMCSEAVKAYKNALRNNPEDDETRYNPALAKSAKKNRKIRMIRTKTIRTKTIRTRMIRTRMIRTRMIRIKTIRTRTIRTRMIRTKTIRTRMIRTKTIRTRIIRTKTIRVNQKKIRINNLNFLLSR